MSNDQTTTIQAGLGYWVGSLASAFRRGLANELEPFNVSPAQWAILELCYSGEANTPSGLARVIPVDTAAVSRQLDRLKDKGLIQRRRSARDRRSVSVGLTGAGRALVPKLAPRARANDAKFLRGITCEEETILVSIIQKMLKNADADDSQQPKDNTRQRE